MATSFLVRVAFVLLGLGFLSYEVMRSRHAQSTVLERISVIAVTIGVIGQLAIAFSLTGIHATTIMSISAALILAGVALDLGSSLYRKIVAGPD